LVRLHAVDRVEPDQRVVLVAPLLTFARLAHRTRDRVPAAQPVPLDLRHRHVDIVRAGQVPGRADERVVVQHVEDSGDGDEHVVLGHLRFGATAATTAAALGPLAAPTPAVPEPAPPAAPAAAVGVVIVAATVAGPVIGPVVGAVSAVVAAVRGPLAAPLAVAAGALVAVPAAALG